MKQQYKCKLTKKILRELPLRRTSMDYCARLTNIENLPGKKMDTARNRLLSLSHTIQAVDHAVSLLSEQEQQVIKLHYFEEHTFDEIVDLCHMERSSVYRHHIRAIDKIALVLYGD